MKKFKFIIIHFLIFCAALCLILTIKSVFIQFIWDILSVCGLNIYQENSKVMSFFMDCISSLYNGLTITNNRDITLLKMKILFDITFFRISLIFIIFFFFCYYRERIWKVRIKKDFPMLLFGFILILFIYYPYFIFIIYNTIFNDANFLADAEISNAASNLFTIISFPNIVATTTHKISKIVYITICLFYVLVAGLYALIMTDKHLNIWNKILFLTAIFFYVYFFCCEYCTLACFEFLVFPYKTNDFTSLNFIWQSFIPFAIAHCIDDHDIPSVAEPKDPCATQQQDFDKYCNLWKQAKQIKTVKGGSFRLRTGINIGIMTGKSVSYKLCERFDSLLNSCLTKSSRKSNETHSTK